MFSARGSKLVWTILFFGMAAYPLSELAELPNVVDMAITGLLGLCFAVAFGFCVVVATTTKLDKHLPEDESR